MNLALRASAPGKLVLIGEYAVLFGAPAVVAAIDRRARVVAKPPSGNRWQVSAPGLREEPVEFSVGESGRVRWHSDCGGRGLELVERLFGGWRIAVGSAIESLPALALELDTTDFFDDAGGKRRKLGAGSSAALTVAFAAVLTASTSAGHPPVLDLERLQRVVSLHRAVQGGRGSGIDVAASLLGGALAYRLDDARRVASARPLLLPETLRWLAVWTGRPATTGAFLERLETRRATHRAAVDRALTSLAAASSAGVTAIERADVGAFLDAVDASWAGFEDLGAAIEMPILSAEHRCIRQLAAACGVHYKPSGAGGGDLGLAFSDDALRLRELAHSAVEAGFSLPGLAIDPDGLLGAGM